jgi:hypothetical protein
MAELHSCYRSSPSDKRKHLKAVDMILRKGKEIKSRRARRLVLLHPLSAGSYSSTHFGCELPNISGHQEVHHNLIACFHGEKLRDGYVSASARSPSRRFSHLLPDHILLVFPSAAVAEEIFPRLGRHPSSAMEPEAFVIVLVSEPFQVRAH